MRDPGDDPRAIESLLERVACLGVRVERGLEGPEALAHVAQRLEHPCTVAHVDALELGSCECPFVELGRHDVGEARRRTVGGCHRIAPCALAVLRLEEVERENRRLFVGATGCVPLEREPDTAVDVASAPVREAGVRGLAQEIVPEGELTVVGLLHELRERLPPLGVTGLRHLVSEDLPHEVEPEHRPHDGRVAEQHPVRRSQRVDPRGEERLDRFRKVAGVVCARSSHELAQEERVARSTEGDVLDRLLRERVLGSHRQRQRRRTVDVERCELEPLARTTSPDQGIRGRPGRDQHEPRSRGLRGRDVAEEETRCVVDPVRVLDDDERRHHQHSLQERRHRRLEPKAALLGVEGVDFGRRRRLGVERHREERKPPRKIGHRGCDEGRELRAGHLTRAGGNDADELPQRIPPSAVRHGLRVLLPGEAQLSEAQARAFVPRRRGATCPSPARPRSRAG